MYYLAKIYPIWKLQFGVYKNSGVFSVLSHMSSVNSNSFWIFTILVNITLSLRLSSEIYHPFRRYNCNCLCLSTALSLPLRCSNQQFMFSTYLPLSFKYSNQKFIFLSTHISSRQALKSKHYVSQLLCPPFRCTNWNYTGCPRRNVPDIGRAFLTLKYTDITQKTYVQIKEIIAREVWNFDSCYSLIDYQIHIETGRNMWFL